MSEKAKHTPGPWKAGVRNINDLQRSFHGVLIGDVFIDLPTGRGFHDGCLIAAAPELLEALEEALGDVDTMEAAISADLSSYDAEGLLNTFGHMRRSMSAAIAKARGEVRDE